MLYRYHLIYYYRTPVTRTIPSTGGLWLNIIVDSGDVLGTGDASLKKKSLPSYNLYSSVTLIFYINLIRMIIQFPFHKWETAPWTSLLARGQTARKLWSLVIGNGLPHQFSFQTHIFSAIITASGNFLNKKLSSFFGICGSPSGIEVNFLETAFMQKDTKKNWEDPKQFTASVCCVLCRNQKAPVKRLWNGSGTENAHAFGKVLSCV